MHDHIDTLDKKYNTLKDQLAKLTKAYEEEKYIKDNKIKQNEELKLFEGKIKQMLLEDRQVNFNFI
jgi:hypothetical protein